MTEKRNCEKKRRIAETAYRALLESPACGLPLSLRALRFPDILLVPYREYSRRTGVPVERLTMGGFLQDGFTVRNLRGKSLIFFDGEAYAPRRTFTVCHELGHLLLGHDASRGADAEREAEGEADYFAAQLMAPDAVIRWLVRRGAPVSEKMLQSVFGLSGAAARQKKKELSVSGPVETALDDRLCARMRAYLMACAPRVSADVDIPVDAGIVADADGGVGAAADGDAAGGR